MCTNTLTPAGNVDRERIVFLRNELTLWALGRSVLTLRQMSAHIIELDMLLQQFDM